MGSKNSQNDTLSTTPLYGYYVAPSSIVRSKFKPLWFSIAQSIFVVSRHSIDLESLVRSHFSLKSNFDRLVINWSKVGYDPKSETIKQTLIERRSIDWHSTVTCHVEPAMTHVKYKNIAFTKFQYFEAAFYELPLCNEESINFHNKNSKKDWKLFASFLKGDFSLSFN